METAQAERRLSISRQPSPFFGRSSFMRELPTAGPDGCALVVWSRRVPGEIAEQGMITESRVPTVTHLAWDPQVEILFATTGHTFALRDGHSRQLLPDGRSDHRLILDASLHQEGSRPGLRNIFRYVLCRCGKRNDH